MEEKRASFLARAVRFCKRVKRKRAVENGSFRCVCPEQTPDRKVFEFSVKAGEKPGFVGGEALLQIGHKSQNAIPVFVKATVLSPYQASPSAILAGDGFDGKVLFSISQFDGLMPSVTSIVGDGVEVKKFSLQETSQGVSVEVTLNAEASLISGYLVVRLADDEMKIPVVSY